MIHTNVLSRRGYTLLEILVAVTLMMLIMLGLTQLFSSVGTQINHTQATLQMAGELRSVKTRLENDLRLVTADLTKAPPMKTGLNQGYFCIIEGMGAAYSNALLQTNGYVEVKDIAHTSDSSEFYDNTVGDLDDILMFTAHAPEGQPFRGLVGGQVRESNMVEIIWFCRGNTLYRRTLLILPDLEFQKLFIPSNFNEWDAASQNTFLEKRRGFGFYQDNDVSVRINPNTGFVVANSLENLALRQNRFGHAVTGKVQDAFPFNIHKNSAVYYLRMPTMLETSLPAWNVSQSFAWNLVNCVGLKSDTDGPYLDYQGHALDGSGDSRTLPNPSASAPFIDYWEEPFPWSIGDDESTYQIDPVTGNFYMIDPSTNKRIPPARYAEDVILTNVISFDIKVWDDEAKRYVNLGEARNGVYGDGMTAGPLGEQGYYFLRSAIPLPCVYDTWSEEYEQDGYVWPDLNGDPTPTRGRNQIDDLGTGVIDHISEWTTPPPYNVPLRGVKISIRAFDPLSKNIREMTIVHHFAGK